MNEMTAWPGGKPPRYYAAIIVRLRPDLRDKAMKRVPEEIRMIVKSHVFSFENKRLCQKS